MVINLAGRKPVSGCTYVVRVRVGERSELGESGKREDGRRELIRASNTISPRSQVKRALANSHVRRKRVTISESVNESVSH